MFILGIVPSVFGSFVLVCGLLVWSVQVSSFTLVFSISKVSVPPTPDQFGVDLHNFPLGSFLTWNTGTEKPASSILSVGDLPLGGVLLCVVLEIGLRVLHLPGKYSTLSLITVCHSSMYFRIADGIGASQKQGFRKNPAVFPGYPSFNSLS